MGTPYLMGGRHESQGGLDCAGYVITGFGVIGIDLDPDHTIDYTNAERLLEHCDPVPKGNEQPGDLIFFQGTYLVTGASHVGVVLRSGTMLDDHGRPSGEGPGETDYSTWYWQQHFLAIGRPRLTATVGPL